MLARAVFAEVVIDRAALAIAGHEVGRAIHPHVGLLRLALARREQRHRRLVDMDHAVAEDVLLEQSHQRHQSNAADAQPLRHARARDVHPRARVDLGLPVQRQMIVVLGHGHLREQPRRGDALVDHLPRHRCGLDRLATGAGVLAADMTQHEELRGNAIQLLADLFADAFERLSAGAVRLLDLVVTVDARQARGQGLANRLALGWRCRGLARLLSRDVLEQGIGQDGVEQHGLRAGAQALAGRAEAPALQACDFEVQRRVPGLLELQIGLHALEPLEHFARHEHRLASICERCVAGRRERVFEHCRHRPSRAHARQRRHSPMDGDAKVPPRIRRISSP
mmetsp:Transcript_39082/g.91536  ORF Transcript_39082/g.91536 Transcript_39082/m.91536 type:complete len:338 (+) Transcript_39082:3007-4020(+)